MGSGDPLDTSEPSDQVLGFGLAQTGDSGESGEDGAQRTLLSGGLLGQTCLVRVLLLSPGCQQLEEHLRQVFVQVVGDGNQGKAQVDGAKLLDRQEI